MKTVGLFGKKPMNLEFREAEVPSPEHNDVIVKVHACGVCGTDINFLRQWEGEAMPLGHEIAGEVVEVGAGVGNLKPGDRVVVEDCSMCGVCDNCKSGNPDICVGGHELNGQSGMGQYLRARYTNAVKFEGLDYEVACLTEPLAVSLNSVLIADVPLQGSVLVLGCGPLGLMSAKVAKLRGAGFVAATEINTDTPRGKARVALAEKMGIDLVVDPAKEDVEQAVKSRCPEGVDRAIVSAPPESIADALKCVAYGGVVAFYGLHFGGRNVLPVDINDLIFKKVTLRPVFAEPSIKFRVAINLLKSGLVPAGDIVTHRFAGKDAKNAFSAIADGVQPIVKAVILPQA